MSDAPKFSKMYDGIYMNLAVMRWLENKWLDEERYSKVTFSEWLANSGIEEKRHWNQTKHLTMRWLKPKTPEDLTAFILKYF